MPLFLTQRTCTAAVQVESEFNASLASLQNQGLKVGWSFFIPQDFPKGSSELSCACTAGPTVQLRMATMRPVMAGGQTSRALGVHQLAHTSV